MKFGKLLQSRAFPEWQQYYCDYKGLKQLIKKWVARGLVTPKCREEEFSQACCGEFLDAINREVEKVNSFYSQQLEDLQQAFIPLAFQLNSSQRSNNDDSSSTVPLSPEDFKSLTALCRCLDMMRSYLVNNHLAFYNILKKFDKKLKQNVKDSLLDVIRQRPFYKSLALAKLVTQAQCWADQLAGKVSAQDYHCPVCLDVLSNPVVLSCAHRFCWNCLGQASHFCESCPICRKPQSLDPRNYNIDASLNDFLRRNFPDHVVEEIQEFQDCDEDGSAMDVESDNLKYNGSDMDDDSLTEKDHSANCNGMDVEEEKANPNGNRVLVTDKFESLLSHQNGSVFIVDIDETLVMTPNDPVLLSPAGLKLFQARLGQLDIDYDTKVRLCRRLQTILDEKVPCEHAIPAIIRELQERGCWVVGCTARYSHMAQRTNVTLFQVGIDLSVHCPIPRGQALQDPETEALFANGVIYTNAMDKGIIFNRFMENVIYRDLKKPDGSTEWNREIPREFVFVDDRVSNCESIVKGLSFAHKLDIPITSYHYTGANKKVSMFEDEDSQRLLDYQIAKFIELQGEQVFTDEEARQAIFA